MHTTPTLFLIIAAVASVQFAAVYPVADAQEVDIQTIYSTEKGACGSGPQTMVEIAERHLIGPGFECTLLSGRPAGTGLVAYEGNCTIDGAKTSQGPALDLGNFHDHFELSLPGRDDWIKLYPCTPVLGLK